MKIEKLKIENLKEFTNLVIQLWEDCDYDEEYTHYKQLINSEKIYFFN